MSDNVSENITELSITFKAKNQNDLLNKTMKCLNAATFITEDQTALNDSMFGVNCTEFINLEDLLRENGTFYYSFSYPEYFQNVSSEDNTVKTNSNYITAENQSYIHYYYEREFRFDNIEIATDISNPFGKITRTFLLSLPSNSSSVLLGSIKEELQNKMVAGTELHIYDKAGYRYYKLTFSSWFAKDIASFTESILNKAYDFELKDSLLPFGKNSIVDNISTSSIISKMAPAGKIESTYVVSKMSLLQSDVNGSIIEEKSHKVITFPMKSTDIIEFTYTRFHGVKFILEFLFIVIIITMVFICIKLIIQTTKKKHT